jgi:hypothetical protein
MTHNELLERDRNACRCLTGIFRGLGLHPLIEMPSRIFLMIRKTSQRLRLAGTKNFHFAKSTSEKKVTLMIYQGNLAQKTATKLIVHC